MTLLDYLKAEAAISGVPLIRAKHSFADRIGMRRSTIHNYAYRVRVPDVITIGKIVQATEGKVSYQDFAASGRKPNWREGKKDASQRRKGHEAPQTKG